MRQVEICIPSYNRYQLTIDSFAQVLDDERISSVTIIDDASTNDSYDKLVKYFEGNQKVKIFRNEKNIDCYANKHESVLKATSKWVILFDSDNTLTPAYLDAIFALPWEESYIYLPEFARPCFSAKKWSGLVVTQKNVAGYVDTNLMTNLNAMNFFINREEYLKVWDGSVDAGSSDSIYFSLCWLKSGGSIFITPNLQYDHRIHADKSNHYSQNSHKYVQFHEQVMQEIKSLK